MTPQQSLARDRYTSVYRWMRELAYLPNFSYCRKERMSVLVKLCVAERHYPFETSMATRSFNLRDGVKSS